MAILLDITAALWLWLLVSLAGLAVLPLTYRLLGGLHLRGYGLARSVGLLLFGYGSWLAAALTRTAAALPAGIALLLVVAALGYRSRLREIGAWLRAEWRGMLFCETMGLAVYGAFCAARGFMPDIESGDKMMDLGIIMSLLRAEHLPAPDIWFAGYAMNYYYFGHWLVARLAALPGLEPMRLFALALPLVAGLAAQGSWTVAAALLPAQPAAARARWGLLAVFALLFAGSYYAAGRALREWPEQISRPWGIGAISYDSSRMIYDAGFERPNITEFPIFSLLLGDVHAHVIALPLIVLAVGVALALALDQRGEQRFLGLLALGALCAGAVYVSHSLDYPVVVALLLVAVWIRSQESAAKTCQVGGPGDSLSIPGIASRRPDRSQLSPGSLAVSVGRWLGACAALVGASYLFFLPFHLHFEPFIAAAEGLSLVALPGPLGRVFSWSPFATDPGELLLSIGWPLLPGLAGVLALATCAPPAPGGRAWRIVAVALLALLPLALWRPAFWLLVPALALAAAAAPCCAFRPRLALGLFAMAVLLIAAGEIVLVREPDGSRRTTLFRFYYQAWTLLALAVPALLAAGWGALGRGWLRGLAALLLAGQLAAGSAYLLVALPQWLQPYEGHWWGLRADAATRARYPDELALLDWLRDAAPPGAVLEYNTFGTDYVRGLTRNRAASYSGRSIPLGYLPYAILWHTIPGNPARDADLQQRARAVRAVFAEGDERALYQVMYDYRLRFLVLGTMERLLMPAAYHERLYRAMEPVWERGEVAVLTPPGLRAWQPLPAWGVPEHVAGEERTFYWLQEPSGEIVIASDQRRLVRLRLDLLESYGAARVVTLQVGERPVRTISIAPGQRISTEVLLMVGPGAQRLVLTTDVPPLPVPDGRRVSIAVAAVVPESIAVLEAR